jgi:hypothetical protein
VGAGATGAGAGLDGGDERPCEVPPVLWEALPPDRTELADKLGLAAELRSPPAALAAVDDFPGLACAKIAAKMPAAPKLAIASHRRSRPRRRRATSRAAPGDREAGRSRSSIVADRRRRALWPGFSRVRKP